MRRPRSGRDVVARARARAVVALADGRGGRSSTPPAGSACVEAVTLGGMPALVSHRRPRAGARDGDAALARAGARRRCGPTTPGPTGLQTVVQRALGDAASPASASGRRCRSTSPGSPSPPAVRALLARLRRAVPPRSRPARARRAQRGVPATGSKQVSRRGPTCKEVVDRIDQRAGARRPATLVAEIEQFLRSQSERRSRPEIVARVVRRRISERRRDQRHHRAGRAGRRAASSASRTAPARCRRCRASRRSSCCARPTTATSFLVYTRWRDAGGLRALAEQPGVPARPRAAQRSRARSSTGSELWSFDVVQEEYADASARRDRRPIPSRAAHRAGRAVRDRRRRRRSASRRRSTSSACARCAS